MNPLDELYQQVILDQSRRPRNHGPLPVPPAVHTTGINPSCGDEIEVWAEFDEGDRLRQIHFAGQGCAISQAAASVMTSQCKGLSRSEARARMAAFQDILTGNAEPDLATLGELAAFAGVRQFPQRVKCAMLAWRALERLLA
jgi:nitrogen fixation NifU-like protein